MAEHSALYRSLSPSAQLFGREIQAAQKTDDTRAGLLAALCFHAAGEGHSCLDLARMPSVFPESPASLSAEQLQQIFSANPMASCIEAFDGKAGNALLVVFGGRLYLKKLWRMECELIALLSKRINQQVLQDSGDIALDLAGLCRNKPVALLTGGPGTGKTTAVAATLAVWLREFKAEHGRPGRVVLAAPTGKAAARMTESWQRQAPQLFADLSAGQPSALPLQAVTLHRLLGFSGASGSASAPLLADLLIVDEASMIDLPMMLRLLKALPEHGHLLLIGDPNQLPSIEIGNVLGALLAPEPNSRFAAALATAHRQRHHNFRQAASPGLAELAEAMQTESPDSVIAALQTQAYPGVDYADYSRNAIDAVLDDVELFHRGLASLPDPQSALQRLADRIILTPLRNGPIGSETLNAEMGRRLGHAVDRHAQAILITENVPRLGLSNGDIGLIWRSAEAFDAHFLGPGGLNTLPVEKLPAHEPAYALTIHKAQGSEFDTVDLLLPQAAHPMLSKALLYTAVTRARHKLNLLASSEALRTGLARDTRRMSGLAAIAAFNER